MRLLALLLLVQGYAGAVELPTVGVDVSAYLALAITEIGGWMATLLGGIFAFAVVSTGIKWARRHH